MKKNTFMRVASALLVAVLLTTCAIAGTFAKYTTSVTGTDQARVAYWGFKSENASITINDLFKTSYDQHVNAPVDVIAPGTTNSATFHFQFADNDGILAPEVAYTLEVSTTGSSIANDIKANANIQWKLDNGEWGTWDAMIAAIEALDGSTDGFATHAENTLPAAFEDEAMHTVYWRWIFSNGAEGDAADTAMGNKVALDEVKLVITITATQID